MINKQGLWFLTLFSLILVLSIYYITMPNEILTIDDNTSTKDVVNDETNNKDEQNITTTSSNYITSLKLELETKREEQIKDLELIINKDDSTEDEKNDAYTKIKDLSDDKTKEETINNKIKEEYKLDSYSEINNDNISIVIESETDDKSLAANIMKTVQSLFTDRMIISVKFTKE